MFAWGSTINGELGVGGIEEEHILAPIPLEWSGADSVVQVACGANHSILRTDQGHLFSCGSNDYGQLGHDQPRKRPQKVLGLDPYEITSVACGYSHSLGLNQWGQVFSWGSDALGQLGHNLGSTLQPTPKIIKTLAPYHIVQISSGKNHSMALTNSGDLFSWGANNYGQLGIGKTSTFEASPMLIHSLQGIPIAFVACGGNHTLVVSKSGAVFGWGKNTAGQLGLNDTISKSYPSQLRSLRTLKIRYISCGEDFSAFLTMNGGVFTCGAGIYGQLGHGSTTNEIIPKRILELMGSTITQIQCGREHTLALVPSRERVYSFGLGGAGQLGCRKTTSQSTPQIVQGPWVSPSGTSLVMSGEKPYSIYRIFAGGDHCFVRVINNNKENMPYDCRNLNTDTQILVIDHDMINNCLKLTPKSVVDQEVITYLETVFKSLSCVNASFLLENERHYYCSSRHHGIDLVLAEKIFSLIGKMENQTVKDIIWNSLTHDLLKQLTNSPPDVEALRVYLILPFYHEFNNPRQHPFLHRQFATSLLSLQTQPRRVYVSWLNQSTPEYFEKLINIFKVVAAYLIRNQNVPEEKTITAEGSLVAMLNVLAFLNKLNYSLEGLKVPYDNFHITDLVEYLDVRFDYYAWLTDTSNNFFLCNYPFIFDAQAKTLLLEADQSIQMRHAIETAFQEAIISALANPRTQSEVNKFVVLNITREKIVEDTLSELSRVNSSDLKKPLKVKFCNEEAEDAGGVKKEFFMLLLREILDPKYGMFTEDEETRAIWFSENSFEDEDMYFLIGQICGLAIYNFTIINIPFPLVLYKKLLKEPITLNDLKGLSPTIANSLQSLLDYQQADFNEIFDLSFDITRESFGELRVIPLKPNGENIKVTQENKQEYVDLYVDYILKKSVEVHYEAFSTGFLKVIGGRVLELFHSHELMAVVIGNENYDWHALEEGAEYKPEYKSSDKVIRWFWEVFHEMSLEYKKKFLLFLTGSDRIPMQGMKAIKIIIQPTNDEKFLPVAHTCFNMLDLPRYKTKERLKYKLLQAIQQTEGFSLV